MSSTAPAPDSTAESLDALVEVLADALRELGRLGHGETANRLAARAYSALRHQRPGEAQRINALMHRLARSPSTPTTKETAMPLTDHELDVRAEPPARRHELIFSAYAELPGGQGFVLVNDHDPKPLYYQLAAEHPGEFSWDYVEQGPNVWRVRIGRLPGPSGAEAA